MRSTLQLLIAAALTGACALAAASPDPAADSTATGTTRASRAAEMRQHFFNQLDTNHDGVVSRDEYRAWVDGRFDKLDANHDGTVDANEIATAPATQERVRKRADHFVKRNDTSGDGKVSLADFEAKAMARFDRMANGADTLTQDQLGFGRRHQGDATQPAAKQ
jgi:hypothetical protein